jgi:hypothetical protein
MLRGASRVIKLDIITIVPAGSELVWHQSRIQEDEDCAPVKTDNQSRLSDDGCR